MPYASPSHAYVMTLVDLPLPLVKPKVLRAVACTTRYDFKGQEWQNMYLYMCCRMIAVCEAYVEMCDGEMSPAAKTRFLNLMANELVRLMPCFDD